MYNYPLLMPKQTSARIDFLRQGERLVDRKGTYNVKILAEKLTKMRRRRACQLRIYSQTELGLQSHRCIVNEQKSSLSSVQGFIDAVLRNVLHPSNNNFPKAILFDYKRIMGLSREN